MHPLAAWSVFCLLSLTLIRIIGAKIYLQPESSNIAEVFHAFALGFRFDLSFVCYTLFLPLFFLLWLQNPFRKFKITTAANRFFYFYFLLTYILAILISASDLLYYSYFQDHLNIMIFGFLEDDTTALLSTFWKNYPVILVAIIVILFSTIIGLVFKKIFTAKAFESKTISGYKFTARICLILLLSLGARGSLGLFPLGVADATISNNSVINYLAFSPLHSLHRAIKLRIRNKSSWDINAKAYGYSTVHQATEDFLNKKLPEFDDPLTPFFKKMPTRNQVNIKKPHVVILMMESFGSYWLQFQSTDFDLLGRLDEHFKQDIVYKNFLPSMTATIGSLSTLMIGTAHRPLGGFLTENATLLVPFRTSPAPYFKESGYHTRFIYGGAIGWRDIDKFARAQGFDSIEGDFEIEKKLQQKKLEHHDWGIYDHDVWSYLFQTLEEAKTPELIVVMTTANHPPYQLPETYFRQKLNIPSNLKNRLNVSLDLAEQRFQAYRYANDALGEFLTKVKNSDLKDNCIIAATGDHGFLIVNFEENELKQKWQVPLYLYIPNDYKPKFIDPKVFASHEDIFASLMPLVLSDIEIPILGKNIFDPNIQHEAYHYSNLAMNANGAIVTTRPEMVTSYAWDNERLVPAPLNQDRANLAKRYRAMMSFLDFYYHDEKQRLKK